MDNTVSVENVDALKNFDFLLRSRRAKKILFCSEHYGEGHFDIASNMAWLLRTVYRKSVAILDLRESDGAENLEMEMVQVQNARDLHWLYGAGDREADDSRINERKLDAHIKALAAQNETVFITLDVKRNQQNTRLPEVDLDGAIIVRSKKSVGAGKSRQVTALIQDANIPVLGLIYNRN